MFYIDYGEGQENISFPTLESAMREAERNMRFTGNDITINNEEGFMVAISRWVGIKPEEWSPFNMQSGHNGFYSAWETE